MGDRLERLELRQEEMATEQRETSEKLQKLMETVLNVTQTQAKETKSDNALIVGKMGDLEKRIITLESGNTTKGDSAFIEQHKSAIKQAKFSIKILNMREIVTEENVKRHLESLLNLTKTTMANMGMVEMYRLGKQPVKGSDSCPPILVFFSTTEMAERILNAARSLGQGRNFKENIPGAYSTAYNDFTRVGIYLKESQGLTYRLRYEGHILQLQVKNPKTEQHNTIDIYEPVANDIEGITSEIDLNCVNKPPEEDKRKLTFILGDIKIDTETLPIKVPEEILEKMDEDETKAMEAAFAINVEKKQGNRITITCKTRQDALLLAKRTGIQQKGTYSLNSLPDCP